jgi:hypothetical protein
MVIKGWKKAVRCRLCDIGQEKLPTGNFLWSLFSKRRHCFCLLILKSQDREISADKLFKDSGIDVTASASLAPRRTL